MHVLALGRRSGKTAMSALVALWDCLLRPELDQMVRPGETRYAVCVATNHSQSRLLVNAARATVESSPGLSPLIAGSTENELRFLLPSGARTALRAFPCSSRGGRGWPVSCLVLDEAAHFHADSDGHQTLDRVFSALVPATAQFGELARVIVGSTPYGSENLFADLYAKAVSGEMRDARAHHATTAEMNPTITPEFLSQEAERDPDHFPSEYLAEFATSGDSYLDFDRITISDHRTLPPDAGTNWIVGLDPAFSKDDFGIAVVGCERTDPRRLLIGHVEAIPPSGFTGAVDEVARIAERYGAGRVITDQYSATALTERLRWEGLNVHTHVMTGQSKTQVFSELRARLYDGTLEIPNDAALIAELRRLRAKFSGSGASVEAPRVGGSHGDRAAALSLAVFEHRRARSSRHRPRTGRYSGVNSLTGEAQPDSWRDM